MDEDAPAATPLQPLGFWVLVAFGWLVAIVALLWPVMRWTVLAGLIFTTLAVVVRRWIRSRPLGAAALALLTLSASAGAGYAVSAVERFKQLFILDFYVANQAAFATGFAVAAVVIHFRVGSLHHQPMIEIAIATLAFVVAGALAFALTLYFFVGLPIVS